MCLCYMRTCINMTESHTLNTCYTLANNYNEDECTIESATNKGHSIMKLHHEMDNMDAEIVLHVYHLGAT